MNKQEAIEKIKNIYTLNINDIIAGQSVDMVIKNQFIDLISQIDEPQKVVVPKFVAEWLEYCKSSYRDLQTVLSRLDDDRKVGDWAYDEDDNLMSEKVDMIARAWLDGYEIEKEKLYTVKVLDSTLFKMTSDNHVRYKLIGENEIPSESKIGNYTFEVNLTEKEIKEADERLWQWAKEVEEK